MLRFVADENVDNTILRGLLRLLPGLDVVRIQDTPLVGTDDAQLLSWAAEQGRILLTHDARTMPSSAYERIATGLPLAGVFILSTHAPVGVLIEQVALIAENTASDEWSERVWYLPAP